MTVETVESGARREARRRYVSPGFRTAFVRGAVAAARGRPADDCPYRRVRGRGGWRVWRDAWTTGYIWGGIRR